MTTYADPEKTKSVNPKHSFMTDPKKKIAADMPDNTVND